MKNKINQEINELLLKKWDPIGIGSTVGAEDEYIQYVGSIYKIIERSSSYAELFAYLWEIETHYMGLTGNKGKTEKFAKTLFNHIKHYA